MHQLGLSAADVAVHLEQERERFAGRLEAFEQAALHAGLAPERAREYAFVQYMHEFTTEILAANNRKVAADLVRLGVITGTILKNGEAAF